MAATALMFAPRSKDRVAYVWRMSVGGDPTARRGHEPEAEHPSAMAVAFGKAAVLPFASHSTSSTSPKVKPHISLYAYT